MPQDITEFQRELQDLISQALAGGVSEADLVEALETAAAQLDSGEGDDADDAGSS